MKKSIYSLLVLLAMLAASSLILQAQNRPNILIVIADDMGVDAFDAYNIGADLPSTPNLDAMLSQGLLFNNAWSYPTCAPSRAALMTGKYGNKSGVARSGPNLSNSEVTIFEHLNTITNDEYATGVFGKWHLGNANHPNQNGIDYYTGGLSSGVSDYFRWERVTNGVTDTATTYATTYVTDEAINWIDNQTQPWISWVAYNAPHGPIHLPPDSMYTRTQVANSFDEYMCMIESVDFEAGRLFASLTQQEKDSTIIIFVGDNGTPTGQLQRYPNRHGKGTVYEGGIRVPMFVTGYGVSRVNEREDAMVSFVDLFATITELLGNDLPGGVNNSFSFLPLLSDPTAPKRRYNYSELGQTTFARAIRNDQYKLIIQVDSSEEFYDLNVDPFEENDLLPGGLSAAQAAIRDELKAEADTIFHSWSCNDGIQNGDEEGIDCGGSSCADCMTTAISQEETLQARVSLFPNPANAELNISSEGALLKAVKLFDPSGKLILHSFGLEASRTILNVKDYQAGLYIVEIQTSEGVVRKKLVKR